jgi:hypothetical protein
MKRTTGRPNLSELCQSARNVLEDQLLASHAESAEDLKDQARRRRLDDLFQEIKRQLETLADPAAPGLARR